MTTRLLQNLSSVLILVATLSAAFPAFAEPLPFGQLEDGTRVMFDSQLPHDYKKAVKHIDGFFMDRPKTAQEYVKRMKASCSKRFGGHGALGMLAALGPEMVEESLQEVTGDSIGFAAAQVAAGPQDDPAWFIHWAEGTLSWDTMQMIGIAVVSQILVERAAQPITNDICAYYLVPSKNKIPLPTEGIVDGSVARQMSQMNPEEVTIAKRIYKNVRVRRALVSGTGMGLGMVLGQNFIEAKNDPNLRLCARKQFTKRWGDVSEYAEAASACRDAARTWFSKTKAADLSASVLSALLSGGITYGIREAGGAALHASGMMDRSQLLRYLSKHEVRARLARSIRYRSGAKAAWYTIRGLKVAAATTGVGFAVEVALEAGTGIIIYYVDQNIFRPIVIPWAKGIAYENEIKSDASDLERSLTIALSGNQNWQGKMTIQGGGVVPMSQTIDTTFEPVESILSNMQFKAAQWRDHSLQDVNEIRSNWMDAVKYPDAVVNTAKSFYETMIDLGGHDTLYPTPLTWDFFTNPNSLYKTPLAQALNKLTANTDQSKKQLDNLVYELDTAYNYIRQLGSADGRKSLINDKLITPAFAKRIETPEVQEALKKDAQKVQAAGLALMAATEGKDVTPNVELALKSLVAMVNDPNSIFGFPALYRSGNGSTSPKWAQALRSNLDLSDKYGYVDGSDSCGNTTKNGVRMVKKVDRYPAPKTYDGKLEARSRCNNDERYAFVRGVYTNRIYMALKNYVGFPFKLQPKVEDVEQILNAVSNGELFQQNTMTAMTPDKPYGVSSPLFSKANTLFGISMPFGAESSSTVRLYSNLDLFVNKLLCGNWLNQSFIGENDVPVLEKFKKEGLRVKMGAPRIAVELDGKSVPFVCQLGTGMAYRKYVDYYAKDFMFLDRKNVAPMRTALSYTGQMSGNYAPDASNAIPRQYTDFLDLAMRRIAPQFLQDPSSFTKLWEERVAKPYTKLSTDHGLQGRYEKLMKQTMLQQGVVWRRKGDYSKCDYKSVSDFWNCATANVYLPQNLQEPRNAALVAFQQDEVQSPEWKRLNSPMAKGLGAYVTNVLEKPLERMDDQSGRGLFASTAADINMYSKILWRVTKNLQGRMSKAGLDGLPAAAKIAVVLRRLESANEVTWQMIDENAPTNPKACSPEQLKKGCTGSRVAAYGVVEAVLPMLKYPSQRAYFKMLEVEYKNARLLPSVKPEDNRLTSNLSNSNDESIDQVMARFADEIKSSPTDRIGTLRAKVPDIAWKFSRTDSFFRTAKTLAMMSVEVDLLRAAKAATSMIWAKKKTPKGEVYILSAQDQVVLNSIVFESLRALRSTFTTIHNQVALFDAFKQGSGDPKVNEAYNSVEELAHKLQDVSSTAFDYFTEVPCQHRAMLDRIYKSRPDLNRSVQCAVEAKQLSLDSASIKRFENVIR